MRHNQTFILTLLPPQALVDCALGVASSNGRNYWTDPDPADDPKAEGEKDGDVEMEEVSAKLKINYINIFAIPFCMLFNCFVP